MRKILYIEDNENFRILVSEELEDAGYQVLTAEHAEEGLRLARSETPELILMDLALPDMDGWTTTGIIKADPALKHIPVIALTANAMQGDREKGLKAGCDEYETKPFNFPRLIEKIEALLPPG